MVHLLSAHSVFQVPCVGCKLVKLQHMQIGAVVKIGNAITPETRIYLGSVCQRGEAPFKMNLSQLDGAKP